MDPAKPLYLPDLVNNSNDAVWDDMENEEPDGTETFDYVGLIIRINKEGVVLYVPFQFVKRIFCHNQYLKNKAELGDWYKISAQRRRPREKDDEKPPLFSHIVTRNLKILNIYKYFPHWCQQNHGGVFEFLLRADVSPNYNLVRVVNSPYYVVVTNCTIPVLVPVDRVDAILDQNNTEKRTFEFWATLTEYNPDAGISLHLLDSTLIDEILPNGVIISLGYGKYMHIENNVQTTHAAGAPVNKENQPEYVVPAKAEAPSKERLMDVLTQTLREPSVQEAIKEQGLQSDYRTVTEGIHLLGKTKDSG